MKRILIPFSLILLALCLLAGCTDPGVGKESSSEETTASECLNHSFGEGEMTKVPTCTVPGVMTYTCTVCGEVHEEAIPINDDHSFGLAETKVEPTCLEAGEALYRCVECGVEKTEELPALGHGFEVWETITAPTYNELGLERSECVRCGVIEEREMEKLVAPYYITLDLGDGRELIVGVGDDGAYAIDTPEKVGYNFVCWKDADGNVISSEGTLSGDLQLKAEWILDGTDTLEELIERAAAGVDRIRITADIVVTEPVFLVGETRIYSDENFTVRRDPDYAGDLFVIGQDKDGLSSAVLGKETKLTLGGGEGVLFVDGNRDKVNVTVLGSAFFISDSAIVDLYDGLIIANNIKLGNERTFTCYDFVGEIATTRPGGAAILLMNGVVNMYGGIIENNRVVTEYTVETTEDGSEILHEDAGCGGAIYNRGNFNMYGGVIRGNEALRGGGIYNDEIVNLMSGTISDNKSHSYGGAVSSSASAEAQMFIGQACESDKTMLFDGNYSVRAGGVLYSNTSSPIIIYGNTVFSNNRTDSSGGAIYTGGALTLRGAEFIGNECAYSGGAVYLHYSNPDFMRREMEITDCNFSENTASLGGAIILSAAEACTEQGTYATITGCSFNNNYAKGSETQAGNGGAMYITRKSEAKIDNCRFLGNKADTNAGAIAIHSEAAVDLTNATFTDNVAALGGAIYTSSKANVTLDSVKLGGNKALLKESGSGGNGGAIYIREAEISLKNVELDGNSAENNAGAIYQCGVKLTLDESISFKNNSAKNHGGAIYITYIKTDEENIVGGQLIASDVTFANNTAIAGGAVSARTDSIVELNNVSFVGNTTPEAEVGTSNGGGAIYANNTSLKLTEVVMDGNLSGYYGGAIKADTCDIVLKDSQVVNSEGGTGGAVYAGGGSLVADGLILKGNTSSLNGVVYLTRITASIKNLEASENRAISGGVLYTNSLAEVGVESSTFKANEANKGGAVCVAGESVLALKTTIFEENRTITSNGGAIYVTGAELKIIDDVGFNNNASALHGGAIYVTEHSYVPEASEGEDGNEIPEEVVVKSAFTVEGAEFVDNHALRGGAIYVAKTEYSVKNSEFSKNLATDLNYGGGAIYSTESAGEISNVSFVDNRSTKGGAVALHSTSSMTVSSMTATGNAADLNTEGKLGVGGAFYVNNSTLNIAAAEDGETIALGNAESGNLAQSGGAIFAENSASVTLSGVSLVNNSANYGGAIYVSGTAALSVEDSVLSGNKAAADAELGGGNGGALYINMAAVTLKNTEFNDNRADLNAGAIYLSAARLELDNSVSFASNSAKNHGGAVYVVYKKNNDETLTGGSLKAVGTLFVGNTALSGGAISGRSESVIELIDASFRNNTTPEAKVGTGDGGGAIYSNNSSLKLLGVVMDGNKSGYYGGAIKADGCTLDIKNTQITGSEGGTGGAIYATGGMLDAQNLTLGGNKSSLNGVIYVTGCETTLSELKAIGNEAVSGGVIFASNKAKVNLTDSEISKNTASRGGAICVSNASVEVSGGSFAENVASGKGGAIYLTEGADLSLSGVTLNKNAAGGNGGAILLEGSSLVFDTDSSLEGNISGNYGGAVCVLEYMPEGAEEPIKSTLTVSLASFKANVALRGGAIYVAKNEYIITDSEFFGNQATDAEYGGGAIYSTESHGVVEGVSFVNNSSHKGGAVALHSTSSMTVSSMVATGNSATLNGESKLGVGGVFFVNNSTLVLAEGEGKSITLGGLDDLANLAHSGGVIHAENGAKITVNGASLVGNKAYAGGAIYAVSGSEIIANGTVMSGNRSDYVQQNDSYDSNMGGGAIAVFNGRLELIGVTLEKNSTEYYGGAILASKSEVFVNGSSVIKENAGGTGAAFYFKNSCTVNVSDAEIVNNKASANGVIYANYSTVDISGVNAAENEARYGGVIYASNSAEITVTDSVLNNNRAQSGGVIYADTAEIAVNGGTLNNNGHATDTHGGASLGGAIFVRNSTLDILGSEFVGNRASENGGAVSIQGSNVTILDSEEKVTLFKQNYAAGHAGAIYVSYFEQKGGEESESVVHPGILTVEGGIFELNTAMAGGAISIRSSCEAYVTNTVFTSNTVTGYSDKLDGNGEGGGAIYVGYGDLTLNNVTMTENIATESLGGAIDAYHSKLTVTGGSIKQNTAIGGGAIFMLNSDATVTGSEIVNNKATGEENYQGGGAINAEYGTLTVSGAIFDGNESAYYGGAINARRGTVVIKDNTEIKGSVGETGAALYFRENNTDVTLTDILVSGTNAKSNGVIYMTQAGKLTVNRLTATDNKAYRGGVFYVSGGNITLEGVTASANHATNGGVFYTSGNAVVSVADSTFTSNSATLSGGAIDHRSSGKLTITDTKFISNTADVAGGAISANGTGAVEITDCTFEGNQALAAKNADSNVSVISRGGGAIFVAGKASVTVNGGSFTSNSAAGEKDVTTSGSEMTDAGGAILVDGGILTVKGAAFSKNTASNGAAIGTSRSATTAMNISSCSFAENVSINNGAAIYIQNGVKNEVDSIFIDSCSFENNTATVKTGSSVYVRTNSSATITNVTSSGGSDKYGDAFYFTGGARVTLGGTVSLSGDKVYVTGAATTAIVNYKTESEKTSWEGVITTANSATVTYVASEQ